MYKLRTFSVCIILFLSGCAGSSSIRMTDEMATSVGSVSIDNNVKKPESLYWRGPLKAWGSVFLGALGGVIGGNSEKLDKELMIDYLKANNINISEIVYEQARNQIDILNKYSISEKNDANATFSFIVDYYGFSKTHPFGSNMDPVIRITGTLTSKNGEILWRESDYVSGLTSGNDKGQSLEVYKNEPQKLRVALERAAEVLIKRITGTL